MDYGKMELQYESIKNQLNLLLGSLLSHLTLDLEFLEKHDVWKYKTLVFQLPSSSFFFSSSSLPIITNSGCSMSS
jgi:hypothetical protein